MLIKLIPWNLQPSKDLHKSYYLYEMTYTLKSYGCQSIQLIGKIQYTKIFVEPTIEVEVKNDIVIKSV